MVRSYIEALIRNLGGSIGIHIRRFYYSIRLGKMGKGVRIAEGVFFDSPADIELGDNVWLDRYVILTAGKLKGAHLIKKQADADTTLEGRIRIGSNSHLGIGTIVQGHGGVRIADHFTSSAHCKIYSASNIPEARFSGTVSFGTETPPVEINQIRIGENVWLGLNVAVVRGSIGKNSFIQANSVVSRDVEENSIAGGAPAVRVKDRFETEGD